MLFFHLENKYVFMFIDRSYTYWWNHFVILPNLDALNVPYQVFFKEK